MNKPEISIEERGEAAKLIGLGRFEEVEFWYDPDKQWKTWNQSWPLFKTNIIRLKPTPKPKTYRPWKPEEVPLGAWLRYKSDIRYVLILSDVVPDGIPVWTDRGVPSCDVRPFQYILDRFEHSTDNGKTWLPCGVEE